MLVKQLCAISIFFHVLFPGLEYYHCIPVTMVTARLKGEKRKMEKAPGRVGAPYNTPEQVLVYS